MCQYLMCLFYLLKPGFSLLKNMSLYISGKLTERVTAAAG